ncbi:DUF1054 family protein [Alloscardovia theropitheci]|nr:DUF1054 family protein [Alloscardovia theropitheci]
MSFDAAAFNVFSVQGLEPRMQAIRQRIWTEFDVFSEHIARHVQKELDMQAPLHIHVAKHARRTSNAPDSTWVAVGGDKRGYKKYPHFQIGINDEYVFIVLACIDNPLYEVEIAREFTNRAAELEKLSDDFIIIPDHTRKEYEKCSDIDCEQFFNRVAHVKRAEFMMGRLLSQSVAREMNDEQTSAWMIQTVDELLPWYRTAMRFYGEEK